MKVTRRHYLQADLEISPITVGGQLVYSRVTEEVDPHNPTERYIVTFTPDAQDAIKVLSFLDEMNGIGWTPNLKRLEAELRKELFDLMSISATPPPQSNTKQETE